MFICREEDSIYSQEFRLWRWLWWWTRLWQRLSWCQELPCSQEGFPGCPRRGPEVLTISPIHCTGPVVGTGVQWTIGVCIYIDQFYHQPSRSDDQCSAHGHSLLCIGLLVYMEYAVLYYHQSSQLDSFVSAHGHISQTILYYLPTYDYASFLSQSGK